MILIAILGDINNKYILNPVSDQDFFSKYIPLLSPIIVIVTFIINDRYTRKVKRKESERTWYFKAYFESQIKTVDAFFDNADHLMKVAVTTYLDLLSKGDKQGIIEFVGATLLALADSKRIFEIEVLGVLKSTYPKIFSDIEKDLMNFEDAGTTAFENDQTGDPYFIYIEEIYKIKTKLMLSLSKPALA
jgi:hypothetical protein